MGTTVTIHVEEEQLHVAAGSTTVRLHLLPLGDFPATPPAGRPVAEVAADTVPAWAAVLVAVGHDAARPVLGGVLLEVGPGEQLTAAATDSYRLHIHTGKAAVTEPVTILVPAEALAALVKATKAANAPVTIGVGEAGTATFTLGATMITARLVEGQFMDYRKLLPDPAGDDLVLRVTDPKAAVAALKAIPKLRGGTRDARPPVVLGLTVGAAPVMTIHEQDVGTWQDDLAGVTVEQTPCERMGFNPAFALDLLVAAQVDGQRELTLRCNDSSKPALLRDGAGFTALLMPVKVP
jgi:DNA polymerase III subunit beta